MGSLGSMSVTEKLKDFLETFDRSDSEILFISGQNCFEASKQFKTPSNVKILKFYNDLPALMKDADIIVSRAGASTITEIISLEKLSILIPSPFVANNHQYYNAKDINDNELGIMLEEKYLNKNTLSKELDKLLTNEIEINKIKTNLKNNKKVDGVNIIYNEIKKNDRRIKLESVVIYLIFTKKIRKFFIHNRDIPRNRCFYNPIFSSTLSKCCFI